jgi:hypothetical protein
MIGFPMSGTLKNRDMPSRTFCGTIVVEEEGGSSPL